MKIFRIKYSREWNFVHSFCSTENRSVSLFTLKKLARFVPRSVQNSATEQAGVKHAWETCHDHVWPAARAPNVVEIPLVAKILRFFQLFHFHAAARDYRKLRRQSERGTWCQTLKIDGNFPPSLHIPARWNKNVRKTSPFVRREHETQRWRCWTRFKRDLWLEIFRNFARTRKIVEIYTSNA